MSTPEESRKQVLTKVPTEGWCWLRQDSPDEHTRQYWRDGKAFCLLAATPQVPPGKGWRMFVYWNITSKAAQGATNTVAADSESLALEAMDQVAIGIHATLVAQGIEIVCLNAAKGE